MIGLFSKIWRAALPAGWEDGSDLVLPQTLKKLGRPQPENGMVLLIWCHDEGLIGETRIRAVYSDFEDPEIALSTQPFCLYRHPLLGDEWLRGGDNHATSTSFCHRIRTNTTSISWALSSDDIRELDDARRSVAI
jgi:hypothetical protein